MRRSKVLAKLRAGKCALMTNPSWGHSPLATSLAGKAGIDAVWIDTEHRAYNPREVEQICMAACLADIDATIRIRKGEGYTSFFRPLEDGAAGIIVPHVVTREETEWVVRNAKYPPLGRRGIETVMLDSDLGYADAVEYLAHANRETFVCIQIEDVEALDNLDAILSVPGLDVIFIGPADLTGSMGIPFQFDHKRYKDAVERIGKAAAKHGKWWGLPVGDGAAAARYAAQGARFFNIGSDYALLRFGFQKIREDFDRSVGS